MLTPARTIAATGLLVTFLLSPGCRPTGSRPAFATDFPAAARTYVEPRQKDELYRRYSGGHSGQLHVAGLPSMRHISTIPAFAPYPATAAVTLALTAVGTAFGFLVRGPYGHC